MTNTKHTPAPWYTDEGSYGYNIGKAPVIAKVLDAIKKARGENNVQAHHH